MGVSLGLQWVVSESWINSLAAGRRRGTILGIFVSVFSGGLALGPFALSFVGSEGYFPFALCAALLIVCGLPLPLAEKPQVSGDGDVPQSILSTVRTAPAENFAAFINGASWGTQISLLPLYAIHSGSAPGRALQLLTGMCVGSLVCQPVLGRLIDRFSPTHVLAVCGAAQLLICAVLAQSISSDLVIWPLVFVWGAAVGGMYTAGLSGLGSKFNAGDLPTASTGFTMIWEVGALCGPVIAGAAMQVWDPHGLAAVLAVLGAFLLLASLRSQKDSPGRVRKIFEAVDPMSVCLMFAEDVPLGVTRRYGPRPDPGRRWWPCAKAVMSARRSRRILLTHTRARIWQAPHPLIDGRAFRRACRTEDQFDLELFRLTAGAFISQTRFPSLTTTMPPALMHADASASFEINR